MDFGRQRFGPEGKAFRPASPLVFLTDYIEANSGSVQYYVRTEKFLNAIVTFQKRSFCEGYGRLPRAVL
jgi:hypothetical protein